jgi:hypothetical protein
MKPLEIIQLLPKYVQILHGDASFYFSNDNAIATVERKRLILSDIELIRTQLAKLEEMLSEV